MIWTSEAIWHLLDLCKENFDQLRDVPKDAPIYRKMANQLVMFGPSAKDVRKMIKSLKKLNSLSDVKVSIGTSPPSKRKKVNKIDSPSNFVEIIDLTSLMSTDEDFVVSPSRAGRKRRLSEELLVVERMKVEVFKLLLVQIKRFHKTVLELLAQVMTY
ncbi:hypothetical protein ACLKA7_006307 [Drosophila subpalustris]